MYWNERIAIVDGLRSPFSKSWSDLNGIDPVSLSTHVARELLFSTGVDLAKVDQVLWGTAVLPRSPNGCEVVLNLSLIQRLDHFPRQSRCTGQAGTGGWC